MRIRLLAAVAVAALAGGMPPAAGQSGLNPAAREQAARTSVLPDDVTPETIDAIADAVIAKLRAKPEILLDIVLSYEDKTRSGRAMVQADDPATGNPDGDVLAVEFWDPACAPCRSTAAALDVAAARDGRTRVVHKDLPTTAESVESSLNAIASGRYAEMRALQTEGRAVPVAAAAEARAKAATVLQRNRDTAAKVKVDVLPTVFLASAGKVWRLTGAADAENLYGRIVAARSGKPDQSAASTTP